MTTAPDPITDRAAAEAFTKKHMHIPLHCHPPFDPGLKVSPSGKLCCWGDVPGAGWGQVRCGSAGKVALADGSTWCGTHAPAAVAKRQADRDRRDAERLAVRRERDALLREEARKRDAFPRFLAALREIEAGHNDPRALAREALGDFLKAPET